jgi:hypothetical protein
VSCLHEIIRGVFGIKQDMAPIWVMLPRVKFMIYDSNEHNFSVASTRASETVVICMQPPHNFCTA